MPMGLRKAMAETFADWEADLPQEWQVALGPVGEHFDRIDADLEIEAWEPIFPARRCQRFPGQPEGAHALSAYDGISPEAVRCMVLGQDPYPEPGFATGRAFEAGNVARWEELDKMFSKSIRAYMQLIVAARTGHDRLASSFDHWPEVRAILTDPAAKFEAPDSIGDRWVEQGTLLLNASLTLSRFQVGIDPHQSRGHMPFWRPLMLKTVCLLLSRNTPIVFIGLGAAAADIFKEAGLSEGVSGATGYIQREHPAFADAVLCQPNPFVLCNSYLKGMGSQPIRW